MPNRGFKGIKIDYQSTENGIFYLGDTSEKGYLKTGQSPLMAAPSAEYIKSITGTSTNGFYWIDVGGVATQVWCDMTNNGGGWMLAMKAYTTTDRWYYDDAYWTNTTLLNETQDPLTYAGHIKTKIFTNFQFKQVRLCGGTITNSLIESWTSSAFSTFMGVSTNTTNSRASWVSFVQTALGTTKTLQGNCNIGGTNKAYNYMYVKIGMTSNNEADCNSNDSAVGFGLKGISPYSNVQPFGMYTIEGGAYQGSTNGWIFLK